MGRFNSFGIFGLLVIGLLLGCKKDNSTKAPPPEQEKIENPYSFITFYKSGDATGSTGLQMTIRDSIHQGTFYLFGTFDADHTPQDIHSMSYLRDGSDTTYNFLISPDLDINLEYITVNGKNSDYATQYVYGSNGEIQVNYLTVDWTSHNTSKIASFFITPENGGYKLSDYLVFSGKQGGSGQKKDKQVKFGFANPLAGTAIPSGSAENITLSTETKATWIKVLKLLRERIVIIGGTGALIGSVAGPAGTDLGALIGVAISLGLTMDDIKYAFGQTLDETVLSVLDKLFQDLTIKDADASEDIYNPPPNPLPVRDPDPNGDISQLNANSTNEKFTVSNVSFKVDSVEIPQDTSKIKLYLLHMVFKMILPAENWDGSKPVFMIDNLTFDVFSLSLSQQSQSGVKYDWQPTLGIDTKMGDKTYPRFTFKNVTHSGSYISCDVETLVGGPTDNPSDWQGSYTFTAYVSPKGLSNYVGSNRVTGIFSGN